MKLLGSFRKPSPVRLGSLLILYALIAVFLVGCAMLVAAALGAQDRVIASPDRLQMVTLSVMKDMNGTNVAALFKAHFVSIEAKPSGEVTTVQTGSYEVDLLKSNDSVVVGGEQYYDKEVWDAVAAIAQREFNKANPSALPQRRRALRAQP